MGTSSLFDGDFVIDSSVSVATNFSQARRPRVQVDVAVGGNTTTILLEPKDAQELVRGLERELERACISSR